MRSENEFLAQGLADKEEEEALGTRIFASFSFCLPLHPHKLRASNRLISFYYQNLMLCKKISYSPVFFSVFRFAFSLLLAIARLVELHSYPGCKNALYEVYEEAANFFAKSLVSLRNKGERGKKRKNRTISLFNRQLTLAADTVVSYFVSL